MSLIDPDELLDAEKIYLAASLREAKEVEAMLTAQGVTYAVAVEELGRTTLFGSVRHGAAFYVTSGQAEFCRSLLEREGFRRVVTVNPGPLDP